jgi:hypothetical protein
MKTYCESNWYELSVHNRYDNATLNNNIYDNVNLTHVRYDNATWSHNCYDNATLNHSPTITLLQAITFMIKSI